jgi:ketosteroid isomerase-like protein
LAANADLIKSMYAAFARGDVPAVLALFDPQIEWNEADGVRYADRNPYRGPMAVAEGVFGRIVSEVDQFAAVPASFIDGGDRVVVEGRYQGKVKATGAVLNAQFAHVYTLQGGRIVRFQQYTDTAQWTRALGA